MPKLFAVGWYDVSDRRHVLDERVWMEIPERWHRTKKAALRAWLREPHDRVGDCVQETHNIRALCRAEGLPEPRNCDEYMHTWLRRVPLTRRVNDVAWVEKFLALTDNMCVVETRLVRSRGNGRRARRKGQVAVGRNNA